MSKDGVQTFGAARKIRPYRHYVSSFWVRSWENPFESVISLQKKYEWLNWLENTKQKYREHSFPKGFLANRASEMRAPSVPLGEAVLVNAAVCIDCLQVGYFSDLPQLLGLNFCPVHGRKLERFCKKCLQPLRFGTPTFGIQSPFICASCNVQIIEHKPEYVFGWGSIDKTRLIKAFGPYLARLDAMKDLMQGQWHFPSEGNSHCKAAILNSLCSRDNFFDISNDFISSNINGGYVTPHTFILCKGENLDFRRLDILRNLALAELKLSIFPHRSADAELKLKTNLRFGLHYEYFQYYLTEPPVNILEYVYNQIWFHQVKCMYGFGEGIPAAYKSQIFEIVLALSSWQMTEILCQIDALTDWYIQETLRENRSDYNLEEETRKRFKYICLRWSYLKEGHITFDIPTTSWLAPFRIEFLSDALKLTVFEVKQRITTEASCSDGYQATLKNRHRDLDRISLIRDLQAIS